MQAIDQCDRIIYRAQIMTSVELALQSGRELEPEVLAHYKALASRS